MKVALLQLGVGMIALGVTMGWWAPHLPVALLIILPYMLAGVGTGFVIDFWRR